MVAVRADGGEKRAALGDRQARHAGRVSTADGGEAAHALCIPQRDAWLCSAPPGGHEGLLSLRQAPHRQRGDCLHVLGKEGLAPWVSPLHHAKGRGREHSVPGTGVEQVSAGRGAAVAVDPLKVDAVVRSAAQWGWEVMALEGRRWRG